MWEQTYGGSQSDIGGGLARMADGDYVICGAVNSSDGDVPENHGGHDYWVTKVNTK